MTDTTDMLVALDATAQVAPMRVVGLQDDGSILLNPSTLTVVTSSGPVLRGFLLDPVFTSSSLPGFGGMVQAYLDVPPSFTGEGIDNHIGSAFLSAFQPRWTMRR